MKRIILLIVLLWALSCFAAPVEEPDDAKNMHKRLINNGTLSMQNTNYGFTEDLQYRRLQKLLYVSASWVSGKIQRRDEQGRKLYWLSYPPISEQDMVDEDHELWTPDLVAVQDTLTSVGFDGDCTGKELLPAYNPLLANNPLVADLYAQYSSQDLVLQSLMGYPAPLPFEPSASDNFCFSIPQDESYSTPGFITQTAYLYDYCPFHSEGQRYLGYYQDHEHYPLGIALMTESYVWNIQNLDYMIISKHTLHNTNAEDSIEDMAISYYMDADIGPASWGAVLGIDDVSGYVKGQGYEFAYSRDLDGDNGLSGKLIANKLLDPVFGDMACYSSWFWRVGQGPDDSKPRSLHPSNQTANEKYWLATGRNPNTSYYVPLRPEASEVDQYEQPTGNDTRTLTSLFGAQPGTPEYNDTNSQGEYYKRLNLDPGESMSYYTVLFVGDSVDDLKAKSVQIEDFISSGMNPDVYAGLPCIPYLDNVRTEAPHTFHFKWYSYSDPDYFLIGTKEYGAPASQWYETSVPGDSRTYSMMGYDPDLWYEVKITAVYNSNSDEILYLDSDVQMVSLSYTANPGDVTPPVQTSLNTYPNPFRESTWIEYELDKREQVKLEVYNLKGQKVRSLYSGIADLGINRQQWDGRDENSVLCSSGVYYLKLQLGSRVIKRKMLLLK